MIEIHLSFNKIGDEGIKYLTESLKINKTLNWINLGFNKIGDKGMLYLSDGLQKNTTIINITLYGNKETYSETEEEIKAILERNLILTQDLLKEIKNGNLKKVKELCEKGTSLNYQDENNSKNSAFHLALLKNQKEIIKYFLISPKLLNRISFHQQNDKRKSIIDLANENGIKFEKTSIEIDYYIFKYQIKNLIFKFHQEKKLIKLILILYIIEFYN